MAEPSRPGPSSGQQRAMMAVTASGRVQTGKRKEQTIVFDYDSFGNEVLKIYTDENMKDKYFKIGDHRNLIDEVHEWFFERLKDLKMESENQQRDALGEAQLTGDDSEDETLSKLSSDQYSCMSLESEENVVMVRELMRLCFPADPDDYDPDIILTLQQRKTLGFLFKHYMEYALDTGEELDSFAHRLESIHIKKLNWGRFSKMLKPE